MDPFTILINIILSIVLTIGSALVQQAINAGRKDQAPAIRGTEQIGGDMPQSVVIGTHGLAGKREYIGSWGEVDETQNAYVVRVVTFGDVPISGMTGRGWINGELSTLDDEAVWVGQGYPVPERNVGSSDYFWWWFNNGTQTVADAYLLARFGADPERPWLSDMIGRGLPYVITTALVNRELWTGIPQLVVEVQGMPLYDCRQDTTAGGSGSQRIDDPSTWTFSDNPIVAIYNILIGLRYEGQWLFGMQEEIDPAQLPYARWAAAMDACDEEVELVEEGEVVGSERRYRIGMEIQLDSDPIEVIQDLLVACNGLISEAAGVYDIVVGDPGEAVGTLTDADVIVTEGTTLDPFPAIDDAVNCATATYLEPEQAWEVKEGSPYRSEDLIAEDDGRELIASLRLEAVFSGTQVQRIEQAVVLNGRRWRKHVLPVVPAYGVYRPLDVLAWHSDTNQYDGKLFLVTAAEESPTGVMVLGLLEIDPADYDWDPGANQRPITYAPMTPIRPAPQDASGYYVEAVAAPDEQGRPRLPAIDVFWSAASVVHDVRAVLITVWLDDADEEEEANDGTLVWEGEAPNPATGSARLTEALRPNVPYMVQIKYVPHSGRGVRPSDFMPVTTLDIKLTDLDIDMDRIGEEVEARVIELDNWARYNTRETIEAKRSAILLNIDGAVGDFLDRQNINRAVTSNYGTAKAGWSEDILVATGPTSAISIRLEELYTAITDPVTGLEATNEIVNLLSSEVSALDGEVTAANDAILSLTSTVGDSSANGLFRVATMATAAGAEATVGLYATASAGDLLGSTAAIYLNAMSDGTSEGFVVANRFAVVSTPAGTAYGIFVVDSGVVWIDEARIRNLEASNITAGSITGDRLVAGTITSTYIDVVQLLASSIFTTNLSVTSANIGTATIDTLNLKDGAVTLSVSARGYTGSATTGSGFYAYSPAFTAPSAPVVVSVSWDTTWSTSLPDPSYSLRVRIYNYTDGYYHNFASSTGVPPTPPTYGRTLLPVGGTNTDNTASNQFKLIDGFSLAVGLVAGKTEPLNMQPTQTNVSAITAAKHYAHSSMMWEQQAKRLLHQLEEAEQRAARAETRLAELEPPVDAEPPETRDAPPAISVRTPDPREHGTPAPAV